MSSKLKMTLRVTSIILVIVMILMHLDFVYIPVISGYKFWITVGAFGLLLISSK